MAAETDLAALKQRLREWISAHDRSVRRFVARTVLSDATVYRLLTIPAYRSTPETWRRLAAVCGWDPDEVLALAGFRAATPAEVEGWTLVARGLTQLGISPERQEGLRRLLDLQEGLDQPRWLSAPNNAHR